MDIIVLFKKSWGKDLFYPISEDALFIAKLTGRPTILKRQLKFCIERGWNVEIKYESVDI